MNRPPPNHDRPMPLWRHLEDLRRSLLWSLAGIAAAMIGAWAFRRPILAFLIRPLSSYLPQGNPGLTVLSVTEAFFFYMKLSFWAGLFIASPWVFYQLWRFIAPGLYAHERRYVVGFVFFTTLFFLLGGWFGYAYIVPLTLKFLMNISSEFHIMITTAHYFTFFMHLIVGIALVFELPVICFILARLGLLNARFMWKFWKLAFVGSFILAAVITPSGDMITQSFLAVPLILLYLFSTGVVLVAQKKKEPAQKESLPVETGNG